MTYTLLQLSKMSREQLESVATGLNLKNIKKKELFSHDFSGHF